MANDRIEMDIAGGLYHELCELPYWRAIRGSGGRAAAVLAEQAAVRLHCYAGSGETRGVTELGALGVEVRPHPAASGVVFAYFHCLSTPHIEPAPGAIVPAPPILVEGEVVLRFGLLEGDAVVHAAGRAVYDPQTARDPSPFAFNGSTAGAWALVVNALELSVIGRSDDIAEAAATVFREQRPAVIIVKRGPAGASVFEAGGAVAHVPAYRSARTFKIGTGDVFSAAFTFWWAGQGLSPSTAADRASRAVAAYCENPIGQLPAALDRARSPVPDGPPGPVLLLGGVATMGQRYTLEEARFRLRELGAEISCPALDGASTTEGRVAAVLAVHDGLSVAALDLADRLAALGAGRVDFAEAGSCATAGERVLVIRDFATALYQTMWAACEKPLISYSK